MHDEVHRWRRIATSALIAVGLLAAGTTTQAMAQVTSTPRPTVVSFKASSASLPAGGGSVTLTAAVKHAATCTFTVTPKLAGLPAKLACSSGKASRRVRLPADTGAANVTYKFGLTVKGAGGTAAAKPVTVVVREAPPGVTGLAASPNGLPTAGGAATVTAAVTRAAKCVISVTPALTGLPKTLACAAGTKPVAVTVPVTLPGLTGTSAQKYTFTLTVSGPNGTTKATAAETVWPTMKWAAPVAADAPGGTLGPVDCVSATFCMALDSFGGYALRFNGKSWSSPVKLERGLVPSTGYSLTAISCASASFCVAADLAGNAFTYNGTSWSASSTGTAVASLSCATASFCVAISGSQAVTYNGRSWSAPVTVSSNDTLASVACPAASFCLAVSSGGNSYAYHGTGWGTKTPFDTGAADVSQVSCASAALCVAIDADGQAVTYTGTWAAPVRVAVTGTGLNSVTCPSATFCLADGNGDLYSFDGKSWGASGQLNYGTPGEISCASATSCVAVDLTGTVYVLSGTTWSSYPEPNGPQHGYVYSVSCPTASFCAATDREGAFVTYNGTSWSVPRQISSTAGLVDSVSCVSPTFCMAVSEASMQNGQQMGGHIYTYDGKTWMDLGPYGYELVSVSCASKTYCVILATVGAGLYAMPWLGGPTPVWQPVEIDPNATTGEVSCASTTFCAVVDNANDAVTYNGKSWAEPQPIIGASTVSRLSAVSCPAATFCTAVDGWGQVFTFNGTTWTRTAGLESGGDLRAVSCTAGRFCAVADLSGNVFTYDGSAWSAIQNVDPGVPQGDGFTGISCPAPSACRAVDWEGNAVAGTA